MSKFAFLFVALIADRLIGDPERIWKRVPHPVVLIGKPIQWADERFNRTWSSDIRRQRNGAVLVAALVIAAVVAGWALHAVLARLGPAGAIIEIATVAIFLAHGSLVRHAAAVSGALRRDGLIAGRQAVALIVGRDPNTLDIAGVCRAAIESVAENASDGIVAPAFWYAVFGLPGLFAYKVINTADSMIGHMTEKHRSFGRAAARLDDLANWLPARITGLAITVAALRYGFEAANRSFRVMIADARLHRSPNAGWPESAMAGALDVALGGPRVYDGYTIDDAFMNEGGRKALQAADIDRALGMLGATMTVLTVVVGLLAL